MKYSKQYHGFNKLAYLSLLIILGIAFITSGCEPGGEPIIDNQSIQDVRITITHVREDGSLGKPIDYGLVPAKSSKELASIVFVKRELVFRIEAKDPSGNMVFSQDYNMDDLEKMDWKITIQP